MDQEMKGGSIKHKWYTHLVPRFWHRKADRFNSQDWSVRWLCFTIDTAMCPQLGLEINLDDIGLYACLRLPYLYCRVRIRLFPHRWHQKSWRVPK